MINYSQPLLINPQTLADRLAWEGARSSLRFNPELAYGRHRGPAPAIARRAAVLVALWREADEWCLSLTLRRNDLSRHRGQVSFPGGYIEAGETSSAAAVREFHEETGCDQPPQLLGSLPECYVYVSDTVVTPWVGLLPAPPQWNPNPAEVERMIIVPIAALVGDAFVHTHAVKRGALEFIAPCYRFDDIDVWVQPRSSWIRSFQRQSSTMNPQLTAVTFDLDGLLINSEDVYLDLGNAIFSAAWKDVRRRTARRHARPTGAGCAAGDD